MTEMPVSAVIGRIHGIGTVGTVRRQNRHAVYLVDAYCGVSFISPMVFAIKKNIADADIGCRRIADLFRPYFFKIVVKLIAADKRTVIGFRAQHIGIGTEMTVPSAYVPIFVHVDAAHIEALRHKVCAVAAPFLRLTDLKIAFAEKKRRVVVPMSFRPFGGCRCAVLIKPRGIGCGAECLRKVCSLKHAHRRNREKHKHSEQRGDKLFCLVFHSVFLRFRLAF